MSARTQTANNAFSPDLTLTPDQQELLMTALTSNRSVDVTYHPDSFTKSPDIISPGANYPAKNSTKSSPPVDSTSADPKAFQSSLEASPDSGKSGSDNLDKSPLLDYDFDETNIDWDPNGEGLFGNLPDAVHEEDGDLHDKRKNHEDEKDGDENVNKRREGEDKSAKKPGRKPLTEPTTKRKAQNRAAQRAFRERKERHLKDLETKVEDLEKASEATNHENGRLRAQVDRLNTELKEYRKRLSLNGTGGGSSPPSASSFSQSRNLYNNSFDIQFAFPKFGDLPGSNFMSNGSLAKVGAPSRTNQQSVSSGIPGIMRAPSSTVMNVVESPVNLNGSFTVASPEPLVYPSPTNTADEFGELRGLFSPSILDTASRSNSSDYMGIQSNRKTSYPENASGPSDVRPHTSLNSNASPSISSVSNNGLDSSCGTTPEPSADSPDNRKESEGELRKTVADFAKPDASLNFTSPSMYEINGFDYLAQQNGGQFDPVLYGGYRDPHENILNNYVPEFFNDAFNDSDFSMPYYTGDPVSPLIKRNSTQEIEVQQNGIKDKVAPSNISNPSLPEKIFDRVPESEKRQAKDFDLDNLCSQFKSKAKCTMNSGMDRKEANEMFSSEPAPSQNDAFRMFS